MTPWFSLLSAALLWGALASYLPGSVWVRRIQSLLLAACATLPLFQGESLAGLLLVLIGTPSATLTQLAALRIAGLSAERLERPVLIGFVLIAIEFYVLALGLGQLDIYGAGFRSPLLVLALFPLGLWLARQQRPRWLFILTLDLLCYASGLHGNLWDALFDPVLLVLAMIALWPRNKKVIRNG